MNNISYPNMFNTTTNNMSTNLSYDLDAIKNSLKAIFYVNKGELLGDPIYGNRIRDLLFDIHSRSNSISIKEAISNEINKRIPTIYTDTNMIKIYGNENDTKFKIVIRFKLSKNSDVYSFETIISN